MGGQCGRGPRLLEGDDFDVGVRFGLALDNRRLWQNRSDDGGGLALINPGTGVVVLAALKTFPYREGDAS
jgi:hypothetical protein